ncbi:hypothetical protein KQX54_012347 [Cotesia glomerata]|uniref:Uncharacterized protein n=1 Tax=Cotesia glomerata TaxID=32391 RepID=A0AAV7J010_COTGL|nr:hypothetical protein KQX54_012347 [Cotesia glomerata]
MVVLTLSRLVRTISDNIDFVSRVKSPSHRTTHERLQPVQSCSVTKMRQYCVITSDKEDFIVIEKSKLYYADEKRKRLMPVTSDDDIEKYNGSLLLKHGESIKHSMEIIDSDGKFY